GLARRQVANRSIAEPAALRFHVDSLGDGELGAGLLHVAAKAEWISCRGARVSDLPAIGTQQVQVPGVGWMNLQSYLKGLLEPRGQLDKFPELVDLQPEGLTAIGHRSIWAAPTGDRGKACARAVSANRPLIEHNGLSNRTPRDVPGRNRTWRSSDNFGDGEVEIVAGQERPWPTRRMPELLE